MESMVIDSQTTPASGQNHTNKRETWKPAKYRYHNHNHVENVKSKIISAKVIYSTPPSYRYFSSLQNVIINVVVVVVIVVIEIVVAVEEVRP